MPTDILKLFTSLGLSPTETKIYLASLGLGPTSVQEIAKKAKLSRTAAYAAIESLQVRGLLSTFERGKKKYFAAEEPENALAHFRGYVKQIEQHIEILERALPEVKMMAGGEKPSVRFYEGDEAIRALFNDVERLQPSFMYEVANLEDVWTILDPKMLAESRKLVDPKKVQIRLLHTGTPRQWREGVQHCELPANLGTFHGDIWIYDNHVAFVSFVGKPVSIIIENKAFAETAKVLFEAAWDMSRAATT